MRKILPLIFLISLTACFGRVDPMEIRVFSKDAVLLELPVIRQQTPNLCGYASAAMLTAYHQRALVNQAATSLVDNIGETGVSGRVLKKALEDSNYEVHVFSGNFDGGVMDIRRQMDRGRPLIVMIGKEPARHYCLLTGYDMTHGLISILDPLKGPRAVEMGVFLQRWAESKRFTLLALPKSVPTGDN